MSARAHCPTLLYRIGCVYLHPGLTCLLLAYSHCRHKAGYTVYITPHSHTYLRQNTLLTRLVTQRFSHADRLHVFIFNGDNDDHTAVIGLYAFQRGHKTHSRSTHTPSENPTHPHQHNNPKKLKQDLLTLINDLKTAYQQLTLLIIGDFQHTVHNNTLHRMGRPQPSPPANILTPCLLSPIHLVSVIPTQHPNELYRTWCSHSGRGQTGLDHILAAPEHIHPEYSCGIDRELSREHLKSDHYLIYATFALSCPNTATTPPASTIYHYGQVSFIPLIKTCPAGPNDNSLPWFAPKTLEILPNDVRAHTTMHDALILAHEHPLV